MSAGEGGGSQKPGQPSSQSPRPGSREGGQGWRIAAQEHGLFPGQKPDRGEARRSGSESAGKGSRRVSPEGEAGYGAASRLAGEEWSGAKLSDLGSELRAEIPRSGLSRGKYAEEVSKMIERLARETLERATGSEGKGQVFGDMRVAGHTRRVSLSKFASEVGSQPISSSTFEASVDLPDGSKATLRISVARENPGLSTEKTRIQATISRAGEDGEEDDGDMEYAPEGQARQTPSGSAQKGDPSKGSSTNPGQAGESGRPVPAGRFGMEAPSNQASQPEPAGQPGQAGQPESAGQSAQAGQAVVGQVGQPELTGQPVQSGQPGQAGQSGSAAQPGGLSAETDAGGAEASGAWEPEGGESSSPSGELSFEPIASLGKGMPDLEQILANIVSELHPSTLDDILRGIKEEKRRGKINARDLNAMSEELIQSLHSLIRDLKHPRVSPSDVRRILNEYPLLGGSVDLIAEAIQSALGGEMRADPYVITTEPGEDIASAFTAAAIQEGTPSIIYRLERPIAEKDMEVVFVVDASGSMTGLPYAVSLISILRLVTDKRSIAIPRAVLFSDYPYWDTGLATEQEIDVFFGGLLGKRPMLGGTSYLNALTYVLESVEGQEGRRLRNLVVIGDFVDTPAGIPDLLERLESHFQRVIGIYTGSVGQSEEEILPDLTALAMLFASPPRRRLYGLMINGPDVSSSTRLTLKELTKLVV